MKKYLETTPKKEISYDHYHQWSGLDFRIASTNWMNNLSRIIKIKLNTHNGKENKKKATETNFEAQGRLG